MLFCAVVCALYAQTPTATLVGILTDPSGALVAGAGVEIRDTATNGLRKVKSDQKGEFIAPNLAPGHYDITILKDGFRTLRQTNLELQADQEARLEFRLELGQVTQTVEVTGSVPLINTENSVKGDVVSNQEIMEMPLINRDFTDLAYLTPGVIQNTSGVGGSSSSPMAINGQRADNSNFLVNGSNARDPRDASAQVHPNLDAVQEFKMEVSGYSAETGRMAGGVMTIVLKSGGNQVHGSLFEFFRNDVLNARNFFDTAHPSILRLNRFGGVIDGPIFIPKLYNGRNRTFFLLSWESFRQDTPSPALGVVPTLDQRAGNFGTSSIKDPLATGTFFPNSQIPASRMNPSALAAQTYLPLPNRPGQTNDFYADPPAPGSQDNFVGKIDQRITNADTLSFRFVRNFRWSLGPYNEGHTGLFGLEGGDNLTQTGVNYTRTFTPRVINEARLSFARTWGRYAGVHSGTDYNKLFGMNMTVEPARVGFPLLQITNFEAFGDSPGWPSVYVSNNYDISDTLTWVKGTHLLKFGGSALRNQIAQVATSNWRGTYAFTGSWTGQPYADFLLGMMNSDSRGVAGGTQYWFNTNYGFFIQDDWKVTSRLTLNLGLRYELPFPITEKYGRLTNFIPEFNKLVIASDKGIPPGVSFANPNQAETAQQAGIPSSLVYPDYKDFAPRLGFAWRPFGGNRAVVRGGYGIFYGVAGLWVNMYNALGAVFPFSLSQTVNRNAANPSYLTFSNPFPVAPNLSSNVTTVAGFQLHQPTPYSQSWNLTVERSLPYQSAIEIGYSGSKGTHLAKVYNLNTPYDRSAALPAGITPYPQWGTISYFAFGFDSIYHAGTVTLRRRFAGNIFYRVNYSFAKSIDDGSVLQGGGAGGYSGVQDARNFKLERGRSDIDMRHVFTTSFSFLAPWKRNLLVRGWQLAGTGIAHTGLALTPQLSNTNPNLGEASRPNRIAKGMLSNPTINRWFNLSAFPPLADGTFGFGNSGRGILDAPGSVAINLALYRNFTVRERGKLQFRWEAFNALNHTNFGVPVVNVNVPNAASITTAGASRQMQVALKYSF